jgi:hypothetical protein
LHTIEIRNYWNNTKQIKYNYQSKLRVASTEVDEETFHNLPTNGNFVSATCGRRTPTTEETTGVFQFNKLAGKYS